MPWRSWWIVAFGVWAAGASAAWAQPALEASPVRRVRVVVPSCDAQELDVAQMLAALRVELTEGALAIVSDDAEDSDALAYVEMPSCTDAVAWIGALAAGASVSARRRVELGDIAPRDRARVLALALAELLRDAFSDAAGTAGPSHTVVSAPSPPPDLDALSAAVAARLAPREPSGQEAGASRWLVEALLSGRSFLSAGGATLGGRVRVLYAPAAHLALGLDAGAYHGSAQDDRGAISLSGLGGGATFGLATQSADLSALLAARIEVGAAWATGSPSSASSTVAGRTLSAPIALIGGESTLRYAFDDTWSGVASISVGYVLSGIEALAGARRATGIVGPFALFEVGVAVAP